MEVKEVLFMKKGGGEDGYVKNSRYTQKVAALTQPIVSMVAQSLFSEKNYSCPYQVLNVADLGCSSGPYTFTVMSTVVESTVKKCSELECQIPEIQFYLNDLVGNDFNTLFKGLTVIKEKFKDVSWFAMGCPGSFHGRLFPRNSMHLFHSSYAVHWLSKVPKLTTEGRLPLNKGKIYISKTSPPGVSKAYLSQFQQDFLLFLKSRSTELVPDGRMVLVIHGRESEDPTDREACYIWEILAKAISYMVSQGLIDEEKLDSFNVPYYVPSKQEVEDFVNKEGSFTTEFIDIIAVDNKDSTQSSPELRAKNLRAFTEPVISSQFGEEEVMEKLYSKMTEIMVEDLKQGNASTKGVSIVLVLKKIKKRKILSSSAKSFIEGTLKKINNVAEELDYS